MIGWMQKKRKYFIVTIWISTLAFIGAGVVGWGAYGFSGGHGKTVAKVGNSNIGLDDFYRKYEQVTLNIKKKYPKLTTKEIIDGAVPQKVLSSMIMNTAIRKIGHDLNIRITDREVADWIKNDPEFQISQSKSKSSIVKGLVDKKPKFSKEKYFETLKLNGLNSNQYEEQVIRPAILIAKTRAIAVPVTDSKTVNGLAITYQINRNVDYQIIKNDSSSLDYKVDINKVKKIYNKNIKSFNTGTIVVTSRIKLKKDNINKQLQKISSQISKNKKIKNAENVEFTKLDGQNYAKLLNLKIGSLIKSRDEKGDFYAIVIKKHKPSVVIPFEKIKTTIIKNLKDKNDAKIINGILKDKIANNSFEHSDVNISLTNVHSLKDEEIPVAVNNFIDMKILSSSSKYGVIKLKKSYLIYKINSQQIINKPVNSKILKAIAMTKDRYTSNKFMRYMINKKYKSKILVDINKLVKDGINR